MTTKQFNKRFKAIVIASKIPLVNDYPNDNETCPMVVLDTLIGKLNVTSSPGSGKLYSIFMRFESGYQFNLEIAKEAIGEYESFNKFSLKCNIHELNAENALSTLTDRLDNLHYLSINQ